ncbi:hypothetical protein [Flavobacterium geliluteum]|uniref:Uncharacterized protein n=1 Tax=Flavobacterium geliluteum TaxID=2816120 RepID=A0A940XFX4_9FLAO|nr:hypothetical protein [Flavobacterium geliluteum]MBP4138989.1 hypothetical protein [Flavobacterium geliluteum]
MAPKQKIYSCIILLVSLISLTTYAQNTTEKPAFLDCIENVNNVVKSELKNQQCAAVLVANSNIISNQFLVKLSIPKDSFTTDTVGDSDTCAVEKLHLITDKSAYSEIARAIIENYRYDFSETFIDILFFENIDLARKRTI